MADNYYSTALKNGSINISEDVIVSLIRTAVAELEDAELCSTAGGEIAELLSIRSASKGIKIQFTDDTIKTDAIITVKYGKNIVETAIKVQESILNALAVLPEAKHEVNVHVSGISFN